MIFFLLKVVNSRRWATVKNARVVITRLERRGPNNDFAPQITSVPFQFCWSPFETSETVQTFAVERIFDLGYLVDRTDNTLTQFVPRWYSGPIGLDYQMVRQGEAVRYHLGIEGENFHCKTSTIVEVAYDGVYTEDLTELKKHLQIRIVK